MMNKTMILLVSDQPMPNLLLALHPELGVRSVILVESAEMAARAERLEEVLDKRGLQVRRERLQNAYDPEPCYRLVRDLVQGDPGRFVVNLTGGTKVMAMGAYRAATEAQVRDILYLEHAGGTAHWLSAGDQWDNRAGFVPKGILSPHELVSAHGFTITKTQDPDDRVIAFAEQLALTASKEAISVLNHLTQAARYEYKRNKEKWPVRVSLDSLKGGKSTGEARHWLDEACKAGLCELGEGHVTFRSKTSCDTVGGTWLEVAAWDALRHLGDTFAPSRLYTGANIKSEGGVENEIDVLAVTGRTLYVIECKTAQFGGPVKPDEIFYKLEHLGWIGGLKARRAFVSLHVVKEGHRKRFREAGIHVIDGEAIRDLKGALASWIAGETA